jgi:hypothetical protein
LGLLHEQAGRFESLWDLRRLSVLDIKESNEFTKRPFAALQARREGQRGSPGADASARRSDKRYGDEWSGDGPQRTGAPDSCSGHLFFRLN